jgi:hypothetical protein
VSADLDNFTSEIYARFTKDFEAHKPCETCSKATGRETMCPAGRARYEQMLGELGDPRFKPDKAPELCADCKAKTVVAPGEAVTVCTACARTGLTFHGWIRDGVFYSTRQV